MTSYELYLDGVTLFESGCFTEARDKFAESSANSPHFKTELYLADCNKCLGLPEQEAVHVLRAYKLHPSSNQAATRYAEQVMNYGDMDLAIKVINDVLKRSPDYGPAIQLRSSIK